MGRSLLTLFAASAVVAPEASSASALTYTVLFEAGRIQARSTKAGVSGDEVAARYGWRLGDDVEAVLTFDPEVDDPGMPDRPASNAARLTAVVLRAPAGDFEMKALDADEAFTVFVGDLARMGAGIGVLASTIDDVADLAPGERFEQVFFTALIIGGAPEPVFPTSGRLDDVHRLVIGVDVSATFQVVVFECPASAVDCRSEWSFEQYSVGTEPGDRVSIVFGP